MRNGSALILGGTIVRIGSSHPTAVSWYLPKKDTELTTLVLVIYADRVLFVVVFILTMVEMSLERTTVSTI